MQSLFLLSLLGAALPAGKGRSSRPLFAFLSVKRANRWPSLLLSVTLHVTGILLMPPVAAQLSEPTDRELWIRQQRIYRSLRIRIPENLYVASTGAATPAPEKKQPVYARRQAPHTARGTGGDQLAAGQPGRARRKFELPPLQRRRSPDTLLQPQFDADMVPRGALHLPEVFFWAAQNQPVRELKPFITPGNTVEPARPRLLDARPRLEVPLGESSALPLPETTPAELTIPTLAGPVLPIQTTEPEAGVPKTGVSAEASSGDAATLLSLVLDPQRLREFLSVPPGNQVGRQLPAGKTGEITGAQNGSAAGAGGNGAGAGKGTEATPATAAAHGTDSEPAQNSVTGEPGPAGGRAAAIAAAAPTRIVHPAGGVFDVVVQSASLEGFPESAGVLSGKPVYSVFVSTGAPKDWILQYCIPAEDDTTLMVAGPVVTLGVPVRLTAPYPRVTLRPQLQQKAGHHVMIHGLITAAGRFEDLRVLGRAEPKDAAATLAVLEQWEFRPATRDGQAVRVEVLLAIPTE